MRVTIDENMCFGAGNCVAAEPDAFALDDESIARPTPAAADLPPQRMLHVARSCPSGALELFDSRSGRVDIFAEQVMGK